MKEGMRIKIARIRKGLKQKELARLAGIHQVRLCRIETGRGKPRPDEIKRLQQEIAAA